MGLAARRCDIRPGACTVRGNRVMARVVLLLINWSHVHHVRLRFDAALEYEANTCSFLLLALIRETLSYRPASDYTANLAD